VFQFGCEPSNLHQIMFICIWFHGSVEAIYTQI